MIKWIVIAIFGVGIVYSLPSSADDSLLQLMSNSMDFKLETVTESEGRALHFEYCNTDVCDLFVSRKTSLGDFLKFLDLYIVYASGYEDLTKYSSQGSPPIPYIIARLKQNPIGETQLKACNSVDGPNRIACALTEYQRAMHIEKYTVRYDENARIVQEDSGWLKHDLSASHIKATISRYSDLGLIPKQGPGR